jgi:hypothetical protein
MKSKILSIILAFYLIFLFECKVTYSNKNLIWNFEYQGLLWVILDHWSIWKYNSNDKPIKWFDWNKTTL